MIAHKDDLGTPQLVQPLRDRLGARDGHAVPVDQAGGDRTGAAPATARSCRGRTASRRAARSATSSRTSSTWRRPCSRPPASPSRRPCNGVTQRPYEGTPMNYTFDDGRRRRAAHDPVLRDARQPRDLPQGLDGRRQAQGPVARARATASTTTSGSSTTSRRTGPSRNDLAAQEPEKLAELQRLFLIQAARFNVLPMDIRSAERFNAEIAGRPALVKGTSQTLYPGMKRLSENSVINIKNKSFTVTAAVDGSRRRRQGRDHRPGRRVRRLELLRCTTASCAFAYNILGIETDCTSLGRRARRRARTSCACTSPTTAADSARAAR